MREHARGKTRRKGQKKAPVAPARLPGLNFDTFEDVGEKKEGAYGTDRAPTYQARYAAEYPKRYVRKFLSWIRGRPSKGYKAKAGHGRRRRAASGAKRHARSRARRALH